MTADPISQPLGVLHRFGAGRASEASGIGRRPWQGPEEAAGPARCRCCESVDADKLRTWDEAAAPYILREPEWRVWRRLPLPEARRRWMRGRVAAKDAVRLLMLDCYGLVAPLESIGVLPDDQGQPQVLCDALPNIGARISVSISHCGNRSVALAAERSESCRAVGIDVASRDDDHDGLAEGGFTPSELASLAGCPVPERADWLLRLWCAKEAVGKALGVGLMGNPLSFIVRRVDRARGAVELDAVGGLSSVSPPLRGSRVTARVGAGRHLTFAVATLE